MTGPLWIASYVALWIAVVGLALLVIALLRQVGVLHARLAPIGGHPAGEGPEVDVPAPLVRPEGYSAPVTVIAFTSETCDICAELRPSLTAFARQYHEVEYLELAHSNDTASTFRSFGVSSTPYIVVIDDRGITRARGVVNSLEQVEEMVQATRERAFES